MPDREKLIEALGEIKAYFYSSFKAMEGGTLACEMFRRYAEAAEGAMGLLKAQEPRVMTWQEIVDTAPQMPFIWLESKENNDRVFQSILFKTWLLDSIVTIITVMTQGWLFEGYHVDYGKTWRCWTSRPTDEQRKVIPWQA